MSRNMCIWRHKLAVQLLHGQMKLDVLLNKYDQEPLSALSLDCLCPAGLTPCSCSNHYNKTRNLSLFPAQTLFAKQGPLPGQVAVWIHRTVSPNPGLVNPESFMETLGTPKQKKLQNLSKKNHCTITTIALPSQNSKNYFLLEM